MYTTFSCLDSLLTLGSKMLLDSYVFTKDFEDLLTLTAVPGATAPTGFVKRVSQTMSRVIPLLKTLQVRPSPPESLVQAYLIHIADKSDANFRKILDLKGIKKQDQNQFMELFSAHKASPRHESLPSQSPLLTPLTVQSGAGGGGMGSLSNATGLGAANLQNLQGRFDPTSLGSALMTVARDGVDRFGSPALSGHGSRAVSPPPGGAIPPEASAGNVNQNLRNIGKFFKRDLSSLGGRFGSIKPGDDSGR